MLPDLKRIKKIIIDAAKEEILPRFNKISYEIKQDGSLVTEADFAADKRIREALSEAYPDIAFLSEEMEYSDQETLLESSPQLWCLDPLDGTRNFAAGIPLFATSIALIVDGEVQIGISYDVIRDEMFSAVKGEGAWLNDEPLHCAKSSFSLEESTAIIDFKYLKPELAIHLVKNRPYKAQRNIGASVLEWAWMAAGRGQVYLHGGMKLWDLAAGTLILSEAGGYSCTLDDEQVFKATMTPRSVILSHDQDLFLQWKSFILNSVNDINESTDEG